LKYALGQEKVDRYATIDKKKEMKGYIQKWDVKSDIERLQIELNS
jgi:hypothetical protein